MRDLPEKQQTVLLALLNGTTRKDAAQTAGVSESTVYRYLSDKDFVAALTEKRQQMFENAINELYGLTVKAAATLRRNLDSGNAAVEVRAAIAVETLAIRARELQIAERLERLERQLAGK
jgi:AcrR family transcriptional regulator